MTTVAAPPPDDVLDKGGLEKDAIGFRQALTIGLASTAPAYSLAAVIGTITVLVGVQAPGALLASFVPMFLIAAAFFYMNRADQDAGTTFSWVTRALGPGSAGSEAGPSVRRGSWSSGRSRTSAPALAAERDARMIVVGPARERPLTGIILGSVPHKLVHRSTVPVLVVPMPDE